MLLRRAAADHGVRAITVVPGVDIVFIAFIFAHLNLAWTETADVFTHLGGAAAAKRADELFFFEENATAACNCLLHDLRKLVEQPGQRHFQLNMIIGDINRSCGHLTTARTRNVIRSPPTPAPPPRAWEN